MNIEQLKNAVEKIDDKYISEAEYFNPDTMKISKSPLIYIAPAAAIAASVAMLIVSNHFTDFNNLSDNYEANNNIQVSDTSTVSEYSVPETSANISTVSLPVTELNPAFAVTANETEPAVSTVPDYSNAGMNAGDAENTEKIYPAISSSPEKTEKSDFTEVSSITSDVITESPPFSTVPEKTSVAETKVSESVSEEKPPSKEPPACEPTGGPPPEEPPVYEPAQPVHADSIDEAKKMIVSGDVSIYPEEYRNAYSKMFRRFNDDGYIFQVKEDADSDDGIKLESETVVLLPYAHSEDTGVLYRITYKGKLYVVFFYFTDPQYSEQFLSMSEYSELRLKFKGYDKVDDNTIIRRDNDGYYILFSMIDAEHYMRVHSYASDEEMTEFMSQLKYEKISLK
ncbi:MAG: hypothetical protein Q4D76_06895 [Oscillospiraceae bacterium]|nr:hypothetical protein [Oscillospiraceae bacterium]